MRAISLQLFLFPTPLRQVIYLYPTLHSNFLVQSNTQSHYNRRIQQRPFLNSPTKKQPKVEN